MHVWFEHDGGEVEHYTTEATWGESSPVKCSPESMASMVVGICNPRAGKEGTGRFLGLLTQQVQLGW